MDAIHPSGTAIAEIKFGADALRTVRTALMNLAYALPQHPHAKAYLVLVDSAITESRLHAEWERTRAVMKTEVLERLTICLVGRDGGLLSIPHDPPVDVRRWLSDVLDREAAHMPVRATRTNYEFVVLKLLLHQWLLRRGPLTLSRLRRIAGCSYPTVARVLKELGSLIKRESDRSVALRYFPREEFARLLSMAERERSTARFVDRSGQPRLPETHLGRLEKLYPRGLAVGGILAARHYFPSIDLVGTPRLDISVHCRTSPLDVAFVNTLDPGLEREDDPVRPANVVVHAVRHADPLFTDRAGGLAWVDPVECLLDLHEAGLEAQATEFLEHIKQSKDLAYGQ